MKNNKRWLSLLLVVVMLFSMIPVTVGAETAPETTDLSKVAEVLASYKGKKVSILGDSISTFPGYSSNTEHNSTIGNNVGYYGGGKYGVNSAEDTWWKQVADTLGMEVLVDNAWGGACIFQPRAPHGPASVGYGDRCVNLHNDHTGEEPDVILVFVGTNDFSYYQSTLGTAEAVDYDTLITDNGDGSFTYATPISTCEAYAIMLHKMQHRYPEAEIICMNLLARRSPD